MQIQTKVTLLFITLTSTVILLLSASVFGFFYYYAFEDFYQRLETRVRIAEALYVKQGNNNGQAVQALRQQFLEKLPSEKEYVLKLDSDRRLPDRLESNLPRQLWEDLVKNGEARSKDGNKFYAGKLSHTPSADFIVIVSATDPYGLQEVYHLRTILLFGFAMSIGLVYLVGKVFSNQTFKPVRQLIQQVRNITAENLHLRLETGAGNDELQVLGQTFNDMLNRLETAFETQNNFVSNASHELRTPLTIIKGEAELALRTPGLGPDHQHSVQMIVQEAEKLTHMLSSLLGMAQSGFDGKKQPWEVIRIDELIWLVKESVDQLYPQNNIRIDFASLPENQDQLQVLGNVNLLKLAVSNIVTNACKYSRNQPVVISLLSENNRVIIKVKDDGIGIPAHELPHVFEPFFRASNTGDFEGYGVGLPLSLNIIRLHKGSIAIKTKEAEGTEMQLLLPVYHPSESDEQSVHLPTSHKHHR